VGQCGALRGAVILPLRVALRLCARTGCIIVVRGSNPVSDLQLTPVRNDADLMAFIALPWAVYQGDPNWVPPLVSERRGFLDRNKNPFFEHARAEYLLARRNGRVVGTIAAFTNDLYNDVHRENIGWFGFFEVLEDPPAARALLQAAEDWARAAGHTSLLGPAQFSSNDEWGLLVDGFDDPPRLLMTYNPPRYLDYLESAGYRKAMDLWAYRGRLDVISSEDELPEKLMRVQRKLARRAKFRLRKVDMRNFHAEVEHVKRIYNKAWEHNWGYVPMTEAEMDKLAEQLKPFVDPDLALFVEHEGQIVGFGLGLPDMNQPLRLAYPRPGEPEAFTFLKLLWHWRVRRRLDWVRIFAAGALPEYQGRGVAAMIFAEMARNALGKGFQQAEMSWILESNPKSFLNVVRAGAEKYKTYRIYSKEL
jgi:GNAT superfamily N-acetyltransferase